MKKVLQWKSAKLFKFSTRNSVKCNGKVLEFFRCLSNNEIKLRFFQGLNHFTNFFLQNFPLVFFKIYFLKCQIILIIKKNPGKLIFCSQRNCLKFSKNDFVQIFRVNCRVNLTKGSPQVRYFGIYPQKFLQSSFSS